MKPTIDLNKKINYIKVNSRAEALELADKARLTAQKGETVVILFEDSHMEFLAPGHDPYQVRLAIEARTKPNMAVKAITEKKKLLTNKLAEKVQQKKQSLGKRTRAKFEG